MKLIKQSISIVLCAVFFAACSSSDGGSGVPAPMPSSMAKIDASNAPQITQGVVDAVFASGEFGGVLVGGGSGGFVGESENGFTKVVGSQPRGVLGYFSIAPIPGTIAQCAVDGSVTVTGQVADPSTLSADDRVVLQFADCDDGTGQVLNGPYQVDINSFSGDLLTSLVHLNATVTLDGFEVRVGQEVASFTGGATLDLDTTAPLTTRVSLSGNSISVSDNTHTATLTSFRTDVAHDANVAPQAYTSSSSGTLTSTLFEGTVDYSTPVPFMGYAGEYPFAGELLVTGADGASVGLLVLDNASVRLEIDPGDGSGIISEQTLWDQVASPLIAAGTGIRGQVLRGPINPGPEILGESNEEPFSAPFSVLDSQGNEVARFKSDENGFFEVALSPGEYTIVPDSSAPILFPEQQATSVTVPEDGFADVVLSFDTGIR